MVTIKEAKKAGNLRDRELLKKRVGTRKKRIRIRQTEGRLKQLEKRTSKFTIKSLVGDSIQTSGSVRKGELLGSRRRNVVASIKNKPWRLTRKRGRKGMLSGTQRHWFTCIREAW